MGLTVLDILVLLLLLGGAVIGWLRGFVMEVLSLGAWIAAILAVKLFHAPLSAWLAGPVGAGAPVLAFALLFGAVFVGGKLVAGAIGRRTRTSILGPVDHLLGVGFGALKGLIGATLLFLVANMLYDTVYGGAAHRPTWMAQSRTYPLLKASSRAIVDWYELRRTQGADTDANASDTNGSGSR
jgi:membrane protein required for colicin V production